MQSECSYIDILTVYEYIQFSVLCINTFYHNIWLFSGFDSPKGIGYERYLHYPDAVLDYWHPLEKAMYPEYFARREQRKKEYIEWYDKKYGKPTKEELASFY